MPSISANPVHQQKSIGQLMTFHPTTFHERGLDAENDLPRGLQHSTVRESQKMACKKCGEFCRIVLDSVVCHATVREVLQLVAVRGRRQDVEP
jgi:hypothetical protein